MNKKNAIRTFVVSEIMAIIVIYLCGYFFVAPLALAIFGPTNPLDEFRGMTKHFHESIIRLASYSAAIVFPLLLALISLINRKINRPVRNK